MCRIFGFIGQNVVSSKTLQNVAERQIKGGPDAQYVKQGNNWGLGNNRLVVQGLLGGVQPFSTQGIDVVYNGEIYNHKELKILLKGHGYSFHSSCDGEVIIPLYELYGQDFVKYLDGMFAIAIIDRRSDISLILASDPSSVKSVYYYWDKDSDTFYFSSELPSLFEFSISQNIRLEAIDEYMSDRAVWHNKTFFKDIYSLGPHSIIVKKLGNEPQIFSYHTHVKTIWEGNNNIEEAADLFEILFDSEIKQIADAEVPICVVTSGGLDSSYVTAVASNYIPNLHCFNISYEGDWPDDERLFAKEVSDYYGATYHQILIKSEEFPEILSQTIHHLGQPNSAPHSLSTYALFNAIRKENFKVAITGEGADEYFAGYNRYKTAAFSQDKQRIKRYFENTFATTQKIRNFAYTKEYKDFLLLNNHKILKEAEDKVKCLEKKMSPLKAVLKFDQDERFPASILRRVDHLSMANSVEVRVPFCQPKITSFASSIPDEFLADSTSVKRIIYKAAQNKLPSSILNRPKQPFTLPITAMLKKGHILFDILFEVLHSHKFKTRGIFDNHKISYLINKQLNNPSYTTANLLWGIMILEMWFQHISISQSINNSINKKEQ